MKVPVSWLREYVDIDFDIPMLCQKLLLLGFEVENVVDCSKGSKGLVVGIIDKIEKSNSGFLCSINVGKECKAISRDDKLKVGDKVCFAPIGSFLKGKLVEKSDGVDGLLCTCNDLDIDEEYLKLFCFDTSKTLILADGQIGEDFLKLLSLEDFVLDISLTANRGDLNSIYFLAREVAIAYNVPIKELPTNFEKKMINKQKNIEISAKDKCKRYMSCIVDNVKICDSNKKTATRLLKCGLRPINNIVDITNYVLLEVGQPMHAYNYDAIEGDIAIKNTSSGIISAINGNSICLKEEILTISDKNKVLAIAGVIGAKNSMVDNSAKTIVFESACFFRKHIRTACKQIGFATDSSSRFEKNVNFNLSKLGLLRALNIIYENKMGDISEKIVDKFDKIEEQKPIKATFRQIFDVLGIKIDTSYFVKLLLDLGFFVDCEGNNISVIPPIYRDDIEDYPDLAEEVIRFYGYDKLKSHLPKKSLVALRPIFFQNLEKLKAYLASFLREIIPLSLINSTDCMDKLSYSKDKFIFIKNPLSNEQNVLRPDLIYTMLNTIAYNESRKEKNLRFFEIGNAFLKNGDKFVERTYLCIGIAGDVDYYLLKAIKEQLAKFLNINLAIKKSQKNFMHKNICCDLFYKNNLEGFFGKVSYETCEKFDIGETYILHLCLNNILQNKIAKNYFRQFPKTPMVIRDIAIVVDKSICADQILKSINNNIEHLYSYNIFDVYEGEQIGAEKKSVAIKFLFASNQTLKEHEIEEDMQKILESMREKIQFTLRK